MPSLFDSLKSTGADRSAFKGDIDTADATLATYSHDASLFEIKPRAVLFPKDSADVQSVVRWVNEQNAENQGGALKSLKGAELSKFSITARSAGTDMSGGAVGASIILDFTRYMNKIIEVNGAKGTVQPGCYYRDFEKETMKTGYIIPTYPASREICAVGGMVANNGGGEKSIRYGKTGDHLASLHVVFTDGNEYEVRPLTQAELEKKIALADPKNAFESSLYKKFWNLIQANYDAVMAAKPDVSKNSAGYYLWNVYDKKAGTFDLCRLIAGSQGTLGIITEITFKLTKAPTHSNILTVFLPDLSHTSQLVNELLPFKPESLETYDDYSMKLAIKFFFDFYKQVGAWGLVKLGCQFLPEVRMMATGGLPKLILMAEFTGASAAEVNKTMVAAEEHIQYFGYKTHIAHSEAEAQKYWKIRRESFNLLRKHVKGERTAPFIDDIIVKPEFLPEFMPKLQKIMSEYKLTYTIAGHLGNGNFHIIPLMDFKDPHSADVVLELGKRVYDLVIQYHGSITAEHNDGIVRTPYLPLMFGPRVYELFVETKKIFDPANILNPGKKVGGTFDDIRREMVKTS
ncbi:MAG: FAD-binding oxidoreductase [Candidatus Pacebacteria bacterium]|nr:FAD-binding oxidoreductase [Candidatus Paceibacterota bacterium]